MKDDLETRFFVWIIDAAQVTQHFEAEVGVIMQKFAHLDKGGAVDGHGNLAAEIDRLGTRGNELLPDKSCGVDGRHGKFPEWDRCACFVAHQFNDLTVPYAIPSNRVPWRSWPVSSIAHPAKLRAGAGIRRHRRRPAECDRPPATRRRNDTFHHWRRMRPSRSPILAPAFGRRYDERIGPRGRERCRRRSTGRPDGGRLA